MRLSVIIVSYNVYPFLDNCLRSVRQAMSGIDGEIIVVDNASVDRTPQLVSEHFPDVKLIGNPVNKGFATANNQAINISRGQYILLLNPDTIVSENTFTTCIQFMDQHPQAGAMGVKMLDGSGRFLPESKRGLPSLMSSFLKMSGLYKLFPRSATWNRYYQGHIGENETAGIEVLSGAFMFIRRDALEQSGKLDEDFFMYGEDIDLSYRITRAGYTIHYVPDTSIIHYKGESTKKSSINYILTFYQAMLIFIRKHPEFSGQQFLIQAAIYIHGAFHFFRQAVSKLQPVLIDILLFAGSFYLVSKFWALVYFGIPHYFQSTFYGFNIPLYTLILVLSMYLHGAYDVPFKRKSSWLGFSSAVLVILVIYAILPTEMRTSRMVILLGSLSYMIWMVLSRAKLSPWRRSLKNSAQESNQKTIIVAHPAEAGRIRELINRSRDQLDIVGVVSPAEFLFPLPPSTLGVLSQLDDIIRIHNIKEIIYSAQDVPFTLFTSSMSRLGPSLRYMLAASTTMNIVGSMSRDTEGESYAIHVHFNLSDPLSRRAKRIFDFLSALILLIVSPLLLWFIPGRFSFLKNTWLVLTGSHTWVAYHPLDATSASLPPLSPGILHPAYPDDRADLESRLRHIHYVYARDYHWTTDLSILTTQILYTGQTASDHDV